MDVPLDLGGPEEIPRSKSGEVPGNHCMEGEISMPDFSHIP